MRATVCLFLLNIAEYSKLRAAEHAKSPNIVIILADDMGFSDPACYGGEIATRNLERLANNGLRYSQFYNTARCWPTRGALLTGYYAQQIRRDSVPGIESGGQGSRPKWARLLPDILKPMGYTSYHSGKWHIDGDPIKNGFQHSYRLEDHNNHLSQKNHFKDSVRLPAVGTNEGYCASTAVVNHAIECLKRHHNTNANTPFFSYVAFTAPHFPLQAPAEAIARYRDKYLQGWDAMRMVRTDKLRTLGFKLGNLSELERNVGPPYHNPDAFEILGPNEVNRPLPWTELTESQRVFQATKMAIHAAMVDQMDHDVGKLLDQIRSMGAWENTLIFFLSDNGASAEIMVRGDGHDPKLPMGSAGTYLCLGPGWSSFSNTPFRRHKTWVHEGGIATPLIAHWPDGIKAAGEIRTTPGHVIDIVPTVMDIVGIKQSKEETSADAPRFPGRSLLPTFSANVPIDREFLWWLHEGNRALRVGDWKIVSTRTGAWELYDLNTDRTETRNLAGMLPKRVTGLSEIWNQKTKEFFAAASKDAPPAKKKRKK